MAEQKKAVDLESRKKALELALTQIEKQFGKGSIMKLDGSIKTNASAIPTGSLALDMALGIGGVPRGRVVEIYGPESSGKTTLTLSIIGQIQKLGGTAAFIDAEHAFDSSYAQTVGVKMSAAREIPSLKCISNSASLKGAATLFFTIFALTRFPIN